MMTGWILAAGIPRWFLVLLAASLVSLGLTVGFIGCQDGAASPGTRDYPWRWAFTRPEVGNALAAL